MDQIPLINKSSFIAAGITLILGTILFFSQTQQLIGSFAAAILAASLVWISYVLVRWLILALR